MQQWGRTKKSLFFHLALFLLLLVVGYGTYNMVHQAVAVHKESEYTNRKIAELTKKKRELEAYLGELQHPEAVEREAKARFNLKKPGEEVVVVVQEKKEEKAGVLPDKKWWAKILGFLRTFFRDESAN